MASKLSLYNDSLLLAGERPLSALTDNVEGRRLLDQVWNNGGVNYCLAQGQWYFALRTQMFDYDPDEDPAFGWAYAFTKPSDWLATSAFCADEYLRVPMTEYIDENGYWYADITPIYVRYVSSDTLYGNAIGDWPEVFKEYVAAYFASKIVYKITSDKSRFEIVKDALKETKHIAQSSGMMAQPTTFPPTGAWARSRRGGGNRERGNRNGPLIG